MCNMSELGREASPANLMGLVGLISWASQYGHEIRVSTHLLDRGIVHSEKPVALELSAALSASINFGYDPADQSVFMALDQQEFEWLPHLPIEEIVVGLGELYVLTRSVSVEGETFEAMAITIRTGQPKLWRAFPSATTIGFMCLQYKSSGYEVTEFAGERYPIRYLND